MKTSTICSAWTNHTFFMAYFVRLARRIFDRDYHTCYSNFIIENWER